MKRTIWIWELFGFAVTVLCGTLLHFLYDWLGGAVFVAPFSGVNESTWEHMKLLFWPMLIFGIAQSFFFKGYESFPCVKLRAILIGLALIPILFYTYNGVIGKSPDWINIAIFFVSAAAAYVYEGAALKKGSVKCKCSIFPAAVLIAIALLFIIFTFYTPEIAIFKDPLALNQSNGLIFIVT